MENNAQINNNTMVIEESYKKIKFPYNDKEYTGEYSQRDLHFIATEPQGNKLYVTIKQSQAVSETDETETENMIEQPEKYPHLHMAVHAFRITDKTFLCYLNNTDTMTSFEKVLFGKEISFTDRLAICVSLSAAFKELESVFYDLNVRQISLDALKVDPSSNAVHIDCDVLREDLLIEERDRKYQYMADHGLMPPEWMIDRETDPVSVKTIRHILAVCIFRIMTGDDPFDGSETLSAYPYLSSRAREKMYGAHTVYIHNRAVTNKNAANNYIGARSHRILSNICPELKKLFNQAFIDGLFEPSKRPSSIAWLGNQIKMMNWYTAIDQVWRIPDLTTGLGAARVQYLEFSNGTILPVCNHKPVYRFMLDPDDLPVNEKKIGNIRIYDKAVRIEFDAPDQRPIVIVPDKNIQISDNISCVLKEFPWKSNENH